jgi:hypothetical protein
MQASDYNVLAILKSAVDAKKAREEEKRREAAAAAAVRFVGIRLKRIAVLITDSSPGFCAPFSGRQIESRTSVRTVGG